MGEWRRPLGVSRGLSHQLSLVYCHLVLVGLVVIGRVLYSFVSSQGRNGREVAGHVR